MRIIGLTGGIACGKSNISATLAELGAVIIDGDALARELTVPNGIALPAKPLARASSPQTAHWIAALWGRSSSAMTAPENSLTG